MDTDDTLPVSDAQATLTTPGRRPVRDWLGRGDTIGRYQIEGVLGAGGMGVVYRARDPDLNRDVAIKLLQRDEDGEDPQLQQRLLREAQAMAQLKHRNLVTVYDVGTVNGRVFIAMEYVPGGTIKSWLRQADRSIPEIVGVFRQAGRGLQAAHDAGLVHRDFKPDNVLIDSEGAPQVVDFGLARSDHGVVDDAPSPPSTDDILASPMTQTGAVLGTPVYMSPEQHNGERADARSDQFSFAVSLYEALYGERPFAGETLVEIAAAVGAGDVRESTKKPIPGRLRAVLLRGLRPDPDERFASVAAMIEAIERAMRPPWWRVVSVVLASLALAAAIVVGIVLAKSREDEAAQESYLSRTELRTVVGEHHREVRECYERAMKGGSAQQGAVTIQFTIDPEGAVSRTEVVDDGLPGTDVARCIASRSMMWTFPAPKGGGEVTVAYPFQFMSTAD